MGSHSCLQGIFPDPGIEPRSPTLQADSLSSAPLGKPSSHYRVCHHKKILDPLKFYKDGNVPTFSVGSKQRLSFCFQCSGRQNNLKLKSSPESIQSLGSKSTGPSDAPPKESWGATTARVSHVGQGYLEMFQWKQSITRRRVGKGRERDSGFSDAYILNSPIEKGRKNSLFLNCPFSRKCSGLNVSEVAHSAGSLCSAVRLVSTMVLWRRQKRLTKTWHTQHACAKGQQFPRFPHQGWEHPEVPHHPQPSTFWAQP